MREWLRSRLTYANVMVTILAFIVLGGGTAVALDGSNTVFSDDIVDDQVRSRDVRDDTLSYGGLNAVDLAPNSVGGSELQKGPLPDTNVVARARGSSSVSTGDGGAVTYPLSNNTWTQAANEVDLFFGEVTFGPQTPGCFETIPGLALVVDGKTVLGMGLSGDSPRQFGQGQASDNSTRFLFEPGAPDPRTLTAKISDPCPSGGNVTVTSLKVNVIGFR